VLSAAVVIASDVASAPSVTPVVAASVVSAGAVVIVASPLPVAPVEASPQLHAAAHSASPNLSFVEAMPQIPRGDPSTITRRPPAFPRRSPPLAPRRRRRRSPGAPRPYV